MEDFDLIEFRKLLGNAHIGVVIHNPDTTIAYANPAALDLLDLEYKHIIGKGVNTIDWNLLDESGRFLTKDEYPVCRIISSQDQRIDNEVIGMSRGDKKGPAWFMVNAYKEGDNASDDGFVVVTFADVTDTIRPFSLEDIIENTQDAILVTEARNIDYPDGPKIIYANHAFESLTGYDKSEMIGETPRMFQGALTDENSCANIRKGLLKKKPFSETLLNYHKNGQTYWVEMSIVPLTNRKREVTHFAAIERDVSHFYIKENHEEHSDEIQDLKTKLELKVNERALSLQRASAKLERLAYFDSLTNLPNRRYFSIQLEKLFKMAKRNGEMIGFAVMDIDDFKAVNDKHGHEAGDTVLQKLAEMSTQLLRAESVIGRYGGEEFVIAISAKSKAEIHACFARIVEQIAHTKIKFNQKSLQVTVSIGAVMCKCDSEKSELDLYRAADKILYQAKDQGKNQVAINPRLLRQSNRKNPA